MADDVTITAGVYTATVAADDIGGIHFQRIKLIHGANGVNAGDVAAANPLPTVQTGALPAGSANIGDVDVLTVPALFTDGTQKSIARGGAKGTTTAADITSRVVDANFQALDVYFNNTISAAVDSILAQSTRKWSALGAYTTAIAGATSAPTLKNLANAAQKIGNEIDLSAGGARNLYTDLDLLCRFQSAPSAGGLCEVYFIPTIDGTNYADGSDSVVPALTFLVAQFPVLAVTTAQRIAFQRIPLPATKFKPLLINKSGQAMTNTDNENVLSYRVYDLVNV